VGEGGRSQALAQGHAGGTAARSQLLGQRRIVVRAGHHDNEVVILGGRADHRRPADVDVLDAGRLVGARGQGLAEGVKVADQKIDRGDRVRRHRRPVRFQVAPRQQAAMDLRVQGLHPAVHDLGKAGVRGDLDHRQPGVLQSARRAAGREQLDAVTDQRARELDQAALVRDGYQGATDRDGLIAGGRQGHGLVSAPAVARSGAIRTLPPHRLAAGSAAAGTPAPVGVAAPSSRRCRAARPARRARRGRGSRG